MSSDERYVYSLYKPIRNRLRQYELIEGLHLVWAYSRNFTFNLPFPDGVPVPTGFNPNGELDARRFTGIPEHEQELLVKEMVLNCAESRPKKSIKQQGELGRIINPIRQELVEKIDEKFTIPGDFLFEFNRMAHRQFVWQKPYSKDVLLRYYKLFSSEGVGEIVQRKFGMTTWEIMILGLYFFYLMGRVFRLGLPHNSTSSQFSEELVAKFISTYSISLADLRTELEECQQMNGNYFYSYNPLLAKPIILYQNGCICPLPLMLYWQTTSGLYYSVIKEDGIEEAFGSSFEKYVGEVLDQRCETAKFLVLPEEKYGSPEKKTTDWILTDENAVLFIECKTKRMTIASKTDLDLRNGLERDLKKMASFVVQVYKQFIDFRDGKYPHLEYDAEKSFYPMVLTLEPWYINFNPRLMEIVTDNVKQEFDAKGIDQSLLDEYPFHIRSCEDFERDIQLINSLGLDGYFEKVADNSLHEFIDTFEYIDYNRDAYKEIFMDPISD